MHRSPVILHTSDYGPSYGQHRAAIKHKQLELPCKKVPRGEREAVAMAAGLEGGAMLSRGVSLSAGDAVGQVLSMAVHRSPSFSWQDV